MYSKPTEDEVKNNPYVYMWGVEDLIRGGSMIKVGDKVVVTEVPEGFGLFGIEVGSVGEVVNRVDKTCVDILFGDGKKFLGFIDEEEYLKSKNYGHTHVFLAEKFDNEEEKEDMLGVGDKVVVTEELHDTLVGIEVGKVGEIIAVDYSDYTKMPYLINFGDFTLWSGREFLVEKVDNKKEKDDMLKVGDKVVVTKVLDGGLDGVEVGRVGKICEVDYNENSRMPYRVDFGDYKWWTGLGFLVEKVEDVETGDTHPEEGINGVEVKLSSMQDFAPIEFFNTYIDEKQDTKESDNTSEGGAYNTVIKKDGLTIYTNYSVDIVGEAMRVGGVNDLVSDFDESEDAGGELGELKSE